MAIKQLKREQEQHVYDELYKTILYNGKLMFAGRLLQRAMQFHPDTIALIYHDKHITYKKLYALASALSIKIVKKYGIKARDRGIICFENSPEFYITYFALWQAGVIVAPVNTFLKEKELAHIITDAQPTIIMTSSDRIDLFKKTSVTLPPIVTELDIDDVDESLEVNDTVVDLDPEELAALLYTSGTTGLPKGVMLSSKNILTNVLQIASLLGKPADERIFGVLPLFHSFAQNTCVWASFFYGITIILVPKIERRFILEALQHKPTIFLGVPALYGLLCLMKTAPLDSVRLFVSGGDALPDKIRAAFGLIYRRKLANGYGLTETTPVISVNLDDETVPASNVGKPLIGITCAIRDEKEVDLKQGEIGVLWVKGDNIMLGYYNALQATHNVLKNGWLNTGDLAYIDKHGKIVITGREKDLIIHKGFNIYPQEIENVILLHPNVIRVGVVGQIDEDGEVPVAFVQLRSMHDYNERSLRTLCMQHLAAYKVPRQFFCDTKELATTATGKIDKKALRALLVQDV
ncbi:MAG TPA: AMP-binding protein [Candidatus Babeliales bacterium]|nr:AMP-binding protein [Candidatus Babeliales bacterium]